MAQKKQPSAKQLAAREKFAQAARERAAQKKAEKEEKTEPTTAPTLPPEPKTTYSDADIAELIRQVQELKAEKQSFTGGAPAQGLQTNNGRLIGTFEKYLVNPANYPDPTERLKNEPKLARFAFPLNYELNFKVDTTSYETKDGINTKEPRFTLQLIKIVMDEETYEPTNKRYMLYQMIFHEDPQAALITAQEHGLEVDEQNEKAFLDEMRYLRMRDWLFGLTPFYPQKAQTQKGKHEAVIGNRIVEVYEVSGADTQKIPFNELDKKL